MDPVHLAVCFALSSGRPDFTKATDSYIDAISAHAKRALFGNLGLSFLTSWPLATGTSSIRRTGTSRCGAKWSRISTCVTWAWLFSKRRY